jgi:hypothetical protein
MAIGILGRMSFEGPRIPQPAYSPERSSGPPQEFSWLPDAQKISLAELQAAAQKEPGKKLKLGDIALDFGLGHADIMENLFHFQQTNPAELETLLKSLSYETQTRDSLKTFTMYRTALETLRTEVANGSRADFTVTDLANLIGADARKLYMNLGTNGYYEMFGFSGMGFGPGSKKK